jgi:UDP-glucose 4-epimerase
LRDFLNRANSAAKLSVVFARKRQGARLSARRRGTSTTLNCGYGHCYSVREIIAAVRRVSGSDFVATLRRAGRHRRRQPAAAAAVAMTPAYDDLDTIVGHALARNAN